MKNSCKMLVGMRFGRWLIVKRMPMRNGTHLKWWCKCDCGRIQKVFGEYLRDGRSTSCRTCSGFRRRIEKHHLNKVLSHVPGNALARGLEYSITHEYADKVLKKQKQLCALTGIPLYFTHVPDGTGAYRSGCNASLDRIDSSKGYVVGNIQWVYKPVNLMKWSLSQRKFIQLCSLVVVHSVRKGLI